MIFVRNRILLIASAIVILLLVVGFSVFGSLNKKPKSAATTNDVLEPIVSKKPVEKVEFSKPLTSSPATGPETLALFSLIPAGILGWNLRKYPQAL